jgi:hypothetical protein
MKAKTTIQSREQLMRREFLASMRSAAIQYRTAVHPHNFDGMEKTFCFYMRMAANSLKRAVSYRQLARGI